MASGKQPKSYIKNLNEIKTFVNEIIDSIEMMEQRNDPKIKEYLDISVNELASFLIKYEKDLDEDTQKKIADIIKNIWDQYYQYVQSIYDKGMKGCSKRDFYFKQSPLKIRIRENLEKLVLQLDSTAAIKCTGTNESALFYIDNMEKLLPILSNEGRKHWIDYYRDIADDETLKKLDEIENKYRRKKMIENNLEIAKQLIEKCTNEPVLMDSLESLRKLPEYSNSFMECCNNAQNGILDCIKGANLSDTDAKKMVTYLNRLWGLYKNAPLIIQNISNDYVANGWFYGFLEDKRLELLSSASQIKSTTKLKIEEDMRIPFDLEKLLNSISKCKIIRDIGIESDTNMDLGQKIELIAGCNFEEYSVEDIEELYSFLREGTAGNYYYIQATTNNGFGYMEKTYGNQEKELIIKINFLKMYFQDLAQFLKLYKSKAGFGEARLGEIKEVPVSESYIKSLLTDIDSVRRGWKQGKNK